MFFCIREGSRFSALRKESYEKWEVVVSTTLPTIQTYFKGPFYMLNLWLTWETLAIIDWLLTCVSPERHQWLRVISLCEVIWFHYMKYMHISCYMFKDYVQVIDVLRSFKVNCIIHRHAVCIRFKSFILKILRTKTE